MHRREILGLNYRGKAEKLDATLNTIGNLLQEKFIALEGCLNVCNVLQNLKAIKIEQEGRKLRWRRRRTSGKLLDFSGEGDLLPSYDSLLFFPGQNLKKVIMTLQALRF